MKKLFLREKRKKSFFYELIMEKRNGICTIKKKNILIYKI